MASNNNSKSSSSNNNTTNTAQLQQTLASFVQAAQARRATDTPEDRFAALRAAVRDQHEASTGQRSRTSQDRDTGYDADDERSNNSKGQSATKQ